MRGAVLVDTGPLYALRDIDDALHVRSRQDHSQLRAQRLKIVVAYSTLVECYALALRKLSINKAHSFLGYVGRSAIFINPSVQDYERAIARVTRYADQNISMADAICAELSERLDLPIWTYDHHFDVMRVSVWR